MEFITYMNIRIFNNQFQTIDSAQEFDRIIMKENKCKTYKLSEINNFLNENIKPLFNKRKHYKCFLRPTTIEEIVFKGFQYTLIIEIEEGSRLKIPVNIVK